MSDLTYFFEMIRKQLVWPSVCVLLKFNSYWLEGKGEKKSRTSPLFFDNLAYTSLPVIKQEVPVLSFCLLVTVSAKAAGYCFWWQNSRGGKLSTVCMLFLKMRVSHVMMSRLLMLTLVESTWNLYWFSSCG